MRDNKIGSWLFLAGIILAFTGLFVSGFTKISSIGTLVMGVSVLLSYQTWKDIPKAVIILFSIPVLFSLSNFLRAGSTAISVQEFYISLGMFLTAISCMLYQHTLKKRITLLMFFFLGTVLAINLSTVFGYFLHKKELDQLLLQSKSIPVSLGMHHIHFGVINALCMAAMINALMFYRLSMIQKRAIYIAGPLILISFHILSSRTGLLAFHSAVFATLVLLAIMERKYRLLLAGLSTIILLNVMALGLSSSFRNKLSNSVEDINSWGKGREINYKSMAMRIEAYKVSYLAMKDKPFIGHGANALDAVLQQKYNDIESMLYEENRVKPHNQYLEYGIKYGIPGLIFVLGFYAFWLIESIRQRHYGLFLMASILAVSCVFESLHERQVSAFVVACSLPVIFVFKPPKLTS